MSTLTRQQRQQRRHAEIRARYEVLFKKGLRAEDVILPMMSEEFHLAPDTIHRIVFQTGRYKKP